MSFIFDSTGTLTVTSSTLAGAFVPTATSPGPHAAPVAPDGAIAPAQPAARIQEAVNQANGAMERSSLKMEFVVDKALDRTIVKVVDTQTNQVLKQIPSESMLAAARALAAHSTRGALVDAQA